MAMRCESCGKGVMYGHNVSHAKNRTRKIFKPNLHQTRVIVDGTSKRMRLCVKCIRSLKRKTEKVPEPQAVAAVL
ncbi:MAG TPA: 50S ribosomal protein L28 [Patescibacteria group bacterium]|nr:50S ribosomal protein L28 [Patescibacteria group bacterium]